MKKLALLATCSALSLFPLVKAHALDSCEDRYTALGDRFNAAYIELDSECYPEDILQSGMLMCYQVSDDCKAKYESLWSDYSAAYNALFEECADSFPVVFIDPVPSEASPGIENSAVGPRKKTPTKKEMSKEIRELKVKLRKTQQRLRKATRTCSRR